MPSRAHTEDQLKVLRAAYLNPEATPEEVAELVGDGALNADYCRRIMNDFYLPDEEKTELEGERSRAKETDNGDQRAGNGVWYECAYCEDFRSDEPGDVRKHIAQYDDANHRGRTGRDPGAIVVHGDDDLIEANRRAGDYVGTVTDDVFALLWAIHTNPDATKAGVSETMGDEHPSVSYLWEGVDADWSDRHEVVESVLPPSVLGKPDGPVRLPDGATKDDVEFGVDYQATVNNVVGYGVFLNLSPETDDAEQVNGLVHEDQLDGVDPWPGAGDPVVVRLDKRRVKDGREGDERTELSFEWVSRGDHEPIPTSRGAVDVAGAARRVRREKPTGAYEGPETGIDATEQSFADRPVKSPDSGDGPVVSLEMTADQLLGYLESDAPRHDRLDALRRAVGDD